MEMTVREIAEAVGAKTDGDSSLKIHAIRSLDVAGAGDLTLLADAKNLGLLKAGKASAAIVGMNIECPGKALLRVRNPMYAFAKALELFYPNRIPHPEGIHPTAVIGENAKIGMGVAIGAYSVIGDSCIIGDRTVIHGGVHIGPETRIGSDCILYSNVSVRELITIGDRVIVHCGAAIGVDGFGYAFTEDGPYKVPQIGTVIIEDDVEIGGNCSIARAALEATVIGRGTKINDLALIGHNVVTGKNCIFSGQTGIAGSTKIGDGVVCGGQVGIGDHLNIAGGVRFAGQSGAPRSIDQPGDYMGTPAKPVEHFRKIQESLNKLPEIVNSFNALNAEAKR